jgi:hypothetical protein
LVIVARAAVAVKEDSMRSESDIRLLLEHLRGLVTKYQALKEAAARSRDQEAELAASTKELSYMSAAQALAWAVGDIEAVLAREDMPVHRPPTG